MTYKILITGAAGFIGSHLVDLLLEKKIPLNNLRLLIPKGESLKNLPDFDFDIIWGDIRDKSIIKKAMQDVKVVYHLAARIDFDGKTYEEYKDVNVVGTQNIINECKNKNIKKFIFFSSIAVFGLPAGVGDIINYDESFPKNYSNYYGRSKFEAEERIIKAHKLWKLPYVIIRPASVYGPRELGPTLALYKAIKRHRFFMIGDGNNIMHYVFVKDLVNAAFLAQSSKISSGDYIIAGEKPIKFKELAMDIAQSIDQKLPIISIPKDLALTISYILEFIGNSISIKSPIFPSRVKTMTSTYYYNIGKAKNKLKYYPKISFEEGSRITGKWYLENNLL